MTRAAEARIDLSALQSNLLRVREVAPSSWAMAIIKANGYGHGMLRVAKGLASVDTSVDAFGVASIDEAIGLREGGISQPVLLLEGIFEAVELELVCRHHLAIVVHHDFHIDILENSKVPAPVPVWMKIDTGMHRLGFPPQAVARAGSA